MKAEAAPFTLLIGDVLEQLATLPDESVHCVVTSPPYWGLRDYGTGEWTGGDPECDHLAPKRGHAGEGLAAWSAANARGGGHTAADVQLAQFRESCGKCGAARVDQQLGLEPTPEQYIERMVVVFREVRRVLRSDGTCWLNIGDSYASKTRGSDEGWEKSRLSNPATVQKMQAASLRSNGERHRGKSSGLKEKDLVGIPWMLAFALRADGWWLRRDIIWSKPNPMPESAMDRPTSAHEYLFLLTKSARYFYDGEAIKEQATDDAAARALRTSKYDDPGVESDYRAARPRVAKSRTVREGIDTNGGGQGSGEMTYPATTRNKRSVWKVSAEEYAAELAEVLTMLMDARGERPDVWTIATEPFPDAHFATFPTKLVEPCVLAGTSERGCCPLCGAPWERIVERELVVDHAVDRKRTAVKLGDDEGDRGAWGKGESVVGSYASQTLGWEPGCVHGRPPVPCTVLDPFGGAGTTPLVARRLGRASIAVELNPEYAALMEKRLERWYAKPQHNRVEEPKDQLGLFTPDTFPRS